MERICFMGMEAALAAVFLIPIFHYLNRKYIHNSRRAAWYCIFALYLSSVYAVVGLPDILYIRFAPNCNFEPFAYMFSDYTNSLLNVLLFVPLGIFLPVLWKSCRKIHTAMLFGFGTSLLIELLQLFTFRATDINDLITNTLGTLLGWWIGRLVLRLFSGIRPVQNTKDIWIVYGISFGVMFFLQPFLAKTIFHSYL